MATLTRTFTVACSIEHAYNYLADFSSTQQWDVNVLQAEKLTPGKPAVGTEFQILVKTGPNKTSVSYRIQDLDPNRLLKLKGTAENFSLTDTIRFEALSEQSTKIDYTIDIELSGLMGKITDRLPQLLDPMTDKALSGLIRALNNEKEAIHQPSVIADRLVIPSMLRFTRYGYRKAKQQWKGIADDLAGKQAVITGATSGLGRETAIALSKMGANITVVARNKVKAEKLAKEIETETGQLIRTVIADLSSIEATVAAAKEIKQSLTKIDILVNNAGALFNDRHTTGEKLEQSFALLLLSPFVMTEALMELLECSDQARVINVSSGGMYTQPIYLDDLQYEKGTFDGSKAYARAKRGLVDITQTWATQHPKIRFNAMHPGWADTPAVETSLPAFYKLTKPVLRTPKEGADTIVWLASANEPSNESGKFWFDRQAHTTAIFPGTRSTANKQQALYTELSQMQKKFCRL